MSSEPTVIIYRQSMDYTSSEAIFAYVLFSVILFSTVFYCYAFDTPRPYVINHRIEDNGAA